MFGNREVHLLFNSEHKLHCTVENGNASQFTHLCSSSFISQLKYLGFAALAAPNPGAIIEEGVL